MTGRHLLRSFMVICVLMSAKAGYANTRYVDSTAGNNTNAGTTWAAAYKTLAYAVNEAHSVMAIDTILVAKGTYYPEYFVGNGTGNRNKSFTFTRDSLVIMGGYASGGAVRNRNLYPTVLSGSVDQNYHVMLIAGNNIDNSLKFNGIEITMGLANSSNYVLLNGNPVVASDGGGIYILQGSPVFLDTRIFSNSATDGGGIYSDGCPTFLNCAITGNSAMAVGGGVDGHTGCITFVQCTISSNSQVQNYGAGGGLYTTRAIVKMKQTLVQGNTAAGPGGGLYFNQYGSAGNSLTDVVVTGNVTAQSGGGIDINYPITITNTTVAGNISGGDGNQLNIGSSPVIKNCIIWGSGTNSIMNWSGSPVYTNCMLDGSGNSSWNSAYGTNGGSNRDVNPAFVNYIAATTGNPNVNGDFRLSACSPAINRGNNSFYTSTDLNDAAGRPRIINDTIDVGAYEVLKPTGRKIYVDSAVAIEGNGNSWATATRSLADAIKVANDGCVPVDSILVAKGTYYPEYQMGSTTGTRNKAFTITRDSLVILGGYPTGGGTRNATANATTMSGVRDTNYHVLLTMGANIDTTLKLDGFTITKGTANGGGSRISINGFDWLFYNRGGGWYNGWGSPMLSNFVITGNASDDYGGGVLNEGNPVVRKMLISNNTSNRGAGWGQITGSAMVDSVTFSNNNASADGGGWYNSDGASTITNSTFNNNTANRGAGFYNNGNNPTVSNSIIRSNTATTEGAGWFNQGGNPVVNNTTIAGNTAGRAAGWYNANGNPSVNNMLMTGNVATNAGGGWFNNGGNPVITNSTIALNYGTSGRDLVTQNTAMTLQNSIIWSSTNSTLTPQPWSGFQNCIVAGSGGSASWNTAVGANNGGNLDINPLFVNAVAATAGNPVTTGDYRLQSCSPAINKGSNTLAGGISKDISGRPRIMADTVDIGCYESARPGGHKIYVDSSAIANGNGNSWATAMRSLAEAVKFAHDGCTGIDTILVAKGTYYPKYMTGNGTTNRDKSFTFTRDSLVVMGGYASGGGVRDPNLYATILSGSVDQNYHVMVIAGGNIDSSLKFIGLNITGGRADVTSSISVNGNTVYNSDGGGIYLSSGSPLFLNLQVNANQAVEWGGGIYSGGCPQLLKSVVTGNTAGNRGGGIHCEGGCMSVNDCTITSNTATQSFGGGLSSISARVNITHTIIKGNASGLLGGGIYIASSSAPGSTIDNTVVSGNMSDQGGGLHIINSSVSVVNTTLVGNGRSGASQVYTNGSSPKFKNSIIWGGGSGSIARSGASPSYFNCIIDGAGGSAAWNISYGVDSGNNSSSDPLFINPGTGDYRLQFCSPAINTGSNTAIGTFSTDVAGSPRIIGTTVDIGAYEKQSTVTPGSFGSNVALSSAGGNASPLLGTSCEDAGWTYYATANNPDSLSFAIQWGTGNAVAKTAAQVQLMLDSNNTLVANGNTGTATMKRYWNVNLNGNALAAPVAVRFFFNPADTIAMRNALTAQLTGSVSSLRWFKTNSVAFNPSMVSATDVNGGAVTMLNPTYGTANNIAYAEFNNITSFSGGTASMGVSTTPLPVQLIDFTARKVRTGQVLLNWEVADEQLARYVVMRSRDGSNYQSVGTVKAEGKHTYTFTDLINESSFANSTIYYRLALEEYSGVTGYSKVARINIGNVRSPIVIQPNPVQHTFTVSQIENTLIGEQVTITDATGKLTAQYILEEGLKVDASQWASGVYFLRLPGGVTVKIVKL